MCEYEVYNAKTKETKLIYGYSIARAMERAKLITGEWTVVYWEYVD